jgi:hypothetical protein
MSINHDLKLRTWLPYDRIEHLLAACCTKRYSMTLENMEETDHGPRKVIRISFEDPADRERFRLTFQKSQEEMHAPVMPSVARTKPRARPGALR